MKNLKPLTSEFLTLKPLTLKNKLSIVGLALIVGWSAVGGMEGLSGKPVKKTIQSSSDYKIDAIAYCSMSIEDQVNAEGYGFDRIMLNNSVMVTNANRDNTRVAFDFNAVSGNGAKFKMRASCKMTNLKVLAINFS